MNIFICYPKCTTCQKALKWLEAKGIEVQVRNIKTENPNRDELEEWLRKGGLEIKRFFNTSGNVYKDLKLKDKLPHMTEEEKLELLATDGMLVKRPILLAGEHVLVGFRETEWEAIL